MLQFNRRRFLGAILVLAGAGGAYKTLFLGRSKADSMNNRVNILREVALSLNGIALEDPSSDGLIGLEERLLARYWSDVKNYADFYAWIGETVRNEFLEQKTINLNGWIVSELERDLAVYAFLMQTKRGVFLKEDVNSFDSAKTINFLRVLDWGPKSTCMGMAFNSQSDGHSSHWFSIDAYNGRLVIYIGGEAVPTTMGTNVITTKIEGANLTRITEAADSFDIIAYDPARNIKQKIGMFNVFSQPQRALTVEGIKSKYFGEVLDWGPKKLTIKNFTGAERMPIWIKTKCAPASTVISLGKLPLKTVFGPNLISGTFQITNVELNVGMFPLTLNDRISGEAVFVGEIEITD